MAAEIMQHQNPFFSIPKADLEYIVEAAQADLMDLRNGRVFLTGCTSFIGKWLVESLLWADEALGLGMKITGLSRDPQRFLERMPHLRKHGQLSWLAGDVASLGSREPAPFSHAIHAANLLNDGTVDWPLRHMDTAVDGIRNVLNAAAACGCSKVLFLSSGAAYRAEPMPFAARSGQQLLRENQALADENLREPNVYGLTKRFLEVYATAFGQTHGIRVPLARCFAFAGAHMPLDGPQALGNFIRDALSKKDIVIKGDGTPVRSYLYGADLVVWLLALLVRGRHGTPYNVGSEQQTDLSSVAKRIGKLGGVSVIVQGRPVEGNAPSVYVPDTERIRMELGVRRFWSLEEALDKTMDWFKQGV